MAWVSWVNVLATSHMKIAYIEQVKANQIFVAALIEQHIHKLPSLQPIDVSAGTAQQPFPAYLNSVERNLQELLGIVSWVVPVAPPKLWLGEWMDVPTFRYSDVNRWFNDLDYLRLTLEYVCKPRLISGTFRSGGSRAQQTVRRR